MMIKAVDADSWDYGEPAVAHIKRASSVLGSNDLRTFIKRAGHRLADEMRKLAFAPGEIPIHLIAMGCTEAYSCFVAGTQVRMGDGALRPIETVKLGETVVDRNGTPGEVITLYEKNYDGPGVELDICGMLDAVTSTANHRYYVIPSEQVRCGIDATKHCKPDTVQQNSICRDRNCPRTCVRYEPEWREAGALKPGDYVMIPVPDRGVGTQTWTWSIPLARVLGYFAAEGCYIKSKGPKKRNIGIQITFNSTEEDTLGADLVRQIELLRAEYPGVYVRGPYRSDSSEAISYHICSPALAARCFRAIGEYSHEKRIGGEVYAQPPDRLEHFIATYLDGDGTCPDYVRPVIGTDEGRYTITTVSRRLALDVQWLLGRLGIAASVCDVPAHRTPAGESSECYHVSFTNKAGEFLQGKAAKYRRTEPLQIKQHCFVWNGFVCRPVRSVKNFTLTAPVYNLEVQGDHTYTVGNGIAVKNCNRNGDGFKEATLRRDHPTFEKYARFFRDHVNTDKAKSYGIIKKALYNEEMRRVELICALNGTKEAADRNGGLVADKEMDKLESGRDIPVSMSTRVPYDVCSKCFNKAASRKDYCTEKTCEGGGLRDNITTVLKCGHVLHADNPHCTFFDISHVVRPADRTAYVTGRLEKAASAARRALSGAELAELLNLQSPAWLDSESGTRPASLAVKLASVLALLEESNPLPPIERSTVIEPLPDGVKLGHALRALADRGVVLDLVDFLALTVEGGQTKAAEAAALARGCLPGVYRRMLDAGEVDSRVSDADISSLPAVAATRWAAKQAQCRSIAADAALRRVHQAALSGLSPSTPVLQKQASFSAVPPGGEDLARVYAGYTLSALAVVEQGQKENRLTRLALLAQNRFC